MDHALIPTLGKQKQLVCSEVQASMAYMPSQMYIVRNCVNTSKQKKEKRDREREREDELAEPDLVVCTPSIPVTGRQRKACLWSQQGQHRQTSPLWGVFWSHYAAFAALEHRAPSAVDLKCWTVSGQPMRILMVMMMTTTTMTTTTSLVLWGRKACPNPHNSWKSCSLISTYTHHKHTILANSTVKMLLSCIILWRNT